MKIHRLGFPFKVYAYYGGYKNVVVVLTMREYLELAWQQFRRKYFYE